MGGIELERLRPSWNELDDVDRKYVLFLAARLAMDAGRAGRDGWMSVTEAAKRVGCSRATIEKAVSSGGLPSVIPPGLTRGRKVRADDLDAWLSGRAASSSARRRQGATGSGEAS